MGRARSSLLVILCVFCLWGSTLSASSIKMVQSLNCSMPNTTVVWDWKPKDKVVDVDWRYGINNTCYTTNDCFGRDEIEQDGKATTSVGVQLYPVQLQKGNKLRFRLKRYVNTTYPHMYKVNATAFLHCDPTFGILVRKDNGSDVYDVPSESLEFGNNYFIVASDYKKFISCNLGLRLNVSVKTENCTGNETGVCGGRGMCVTNKYQENYACHCCGTYKGENCSLFDACLSQPCQNGGVCYHGNNQTKGFQCDCAIGYHGDHCEHKAHNLCDVIKCQNNGTCSGNATAFNCTCRAGWTGSQCEVDIDDCNSWPCRHGHCTDRLNGYNCSCFPGYYGNDCEYERKGCKFSPCQNGGFCENQTTSQEFKYKCRCPPGWNGTDCSQRISPCTPNPCTRRGFCMEEYNGFKCVCQPGFYGHRCEININDCESNPCLHGGLCMDLEQGHLCRCEQPYYGSNCQHSLSSQNYWPVVDRVITHVVVVTDGRSGQDVLPVVAGVLTAGILVLVLVLIGFYLRAHGGSVGIRDHLAGLRAFLNRKKTPSDLTVQVNVANTQDCPLTSDAFFQGSGLKLDHGIDNKSYESELV